MLGPEWSNATGLLILGISKAVLAFIAFQIRKWL